MFRTNTLIPVTANHYFLFGVDVGTTGCNGLGTASATDPQYQFQVFDGSGTTTTLGTPVNPCVGTLSSVTVGNLQTSPFPATKTVYGKSLISTVPALFTGSLLGVKLYSASGATFGNDAAFDNISVTDVTPTLDKAFSPSTVSVGQTSTLTFTITNTTDLLQKSGWTFTDTLPSGLTLTTPAAATTCGAGTTVSAPNNGTVIAVTGGNLLAASAFCTITVNVTSNTVGGYTNGPANITNLVSINAPQNATVTFTPAADLSIVKSGTTSAKVGASASYTLTVWNQGPTSVATSAVADSVNPSFLNTVTWVCQAFGAASCGATTSGSGNAISVTTGALPVNASAAAPSSGSYLVYTVAGVASNVGTYSNTATVTAPGGTTDLNPGNNTSTVSGIVVSAAVLPPATCISGNPVNLLAPTSQTYYNNLPANGSKAAGTSTYAFGVIDSDSTSYTQVVPLIASAPSYTLGTGSGNRFIVDLRWNWSNGQPEISKPSVLTLQVNGTDYARMTTTDGIGTVGTLVGLNGAAVSVGTVSAGGGPASYGSNPLTRGYVTLPASVTAIGSSQFTYSNSTAGGSSGDDVAYNLDSIYACSPTVKLAKISTAGTGTFNFSAITNAQVYTSGNALSATPTSDSVTTITAGTAVSSPNTLVVTSAPGSSSVSISEALTAGFGLKSAVCTDSNGSNNSNGSATFGVLGGTVLTIPAANIKGNSALICTFTNTLNPTLTLSKISVGGTGSFTFSDGGSFSDSVTTTTPDTLKAGTTRSLTASGVATTITETPATGFAMSSVSCTGLNGGTLTPNYAAGTFTLDAAATAAGNAVACTVTNAAQTDLSISKTDGAASVGSGGTSIYTIRVSNGGPSSVTGAVVKDPAATGLSKTAAACTAASGNLCTSAPTTAALESAPGLSLPALAPGGFYEFTVTATVTASSGSIVNTATAAPPSGVINTGSSCVAPAIFTPATGVCSATDTDAVVASPIVTLKKYQRLATAAPGSIHTAPDFKFTSGPLTALPGDVLEYCIVYSNTGGTAADFRLSDTVPTNSTALLSAYATNIGIYYAVNRATAAGDGAPPTGGTNLSNASDADTGTLTSSMLVLNLGAAGVPAGSVATPSVGTVCFQTTIN